MARRRVALTASSSTLPSPDLAACVSASSAACTRLPVAARADLGEARELRLAHGAVVDLEDLHRILGGEAVLVDADDHVLAAVDARLLARGRFLDAHLRHPGLDGACHAALLLDLGDELPGAVGDLLGQRLHQVGTAPADRSCW